MKKWYYILILLISLNSFSQSLKCCKNVEEVKKAIEGDWKLKGETKNVIYRFSFDKDKGSIEVLEELNLPPKATEKQSQDSIIDEHEIVNIISENGVYSVSWVVL